MDRYKIKEIIMYVLIILSIILSIFMVQTPLIKYYSLYINPIIWLVLTVLGYTMLTDSAVHAKNKYEKTQTLIILLITYIILYFGLGLIFGYAYNPYSQKLSVLIQNMVSILSVGIMQEYIRYKLLNCSKPNLLKIVFISLIFVLVEINIFTFASNFQSSLQSFKYISTVLIPMTTSSFLLSYLALKIGKIASFAYKIIMIFLMILPPILPNLPWIITSLLGVMFPLIIWYYMEYIDEKKEKRKSRREIRKSNPWLLFPQLLVVITFICFIVGWFKYKPVAIMSNSMKDEFSRGDVVIIEKINKNSLKQIEMYDIIYYRIEDKYIIHRIVDKKVENGNVIYITKGDNNDEVDSWEIAEDKIEGVVRFSVPYFGYPSVWMSEFLLGE